MKFSGRGAGLAALGIFAFFAQTASATACTVGSTTCATDPDGKVCDATSLTCSCAASTDCGSNTTPVCNTNTKKCQAYCTADSQCGTTQKCNTAKNYCVECLSDGNCGTGKFCAVTAAQTNNDNTKLNTCQTGCINDSVCPLDSPKCDPTTRQCVNPATQSTSRASTSAPASSSGAISSAPVSSISVSVPVSSVSVPVLSSSSAAPASSAGASSSAAPVSSAGASSSAAPVSSAGASSSAAAVSSAAPTGTDSAAVASSGTASSAAATSSAAVASPPTGYQPPPPPASNTPITFAQFRSLPVGQSAIVQTANGPKLLTNLGCRSVAPGSVPFNDNTIKTVPLAGSEACANACGDNSLSEYVNNACNCGNVYSSFATPVPCPAGLLRRQGTNVGQGVQVNPVPGSTSSSTVSSTASGSGSASASASASATGSASTSRASTSSGSVSGSATVSTSGSATVSTSGSATGTATGTASVSATTGSSTRPSSTLSTSTGTASASGIATPSAGVVNPINVGVFTYLGCYRSPSSFPTFAIAQSASTMTNDRCIGVCTPLGKRFAATYANDCFCGDAIDDVNEPKVSDDQCNIPCGGSPSTQRCGGVFGTVAKRQLAGVIAANVRFTIYVRASTGTGVIPIGGASVTGAGVATGSGGVIVPTGAPTGIPSSNKCYGDDCYKTINCYGQYCTFNFGCFGPECGRRVVYSDGVWRPEACNGGSDCGRKIVCKTGTCGYATKGMIEYEQKITCYGNYCEVEKCSGDLCNQKCMCKDGSCTFTPCSASEALNKYEYSNGQYTLVKACDGSCPTPAPPCSTCGYVVQPLPCTSVTCNGASCTTVVTTPPPVTKVPYQSTPPAVQPPVQTPVGPGAPAGPGASAGPGAPARPGASAGPGAPGAPAAPGQPQGPGVPQGPVATGQIPSSPSGKPPVVVTAGASNFVATLGAVVLSAVAAALIL
ncbi:hypothetical protein LZ31DRAFT_633935 [Colletotrichum somersetense]|nr:hypothetical protein LZ31DRAFT_633935 [Colletotrichum somersetense]